MPIAATRLRTAPSLGILLALVLLVLTLHMATLWTVDLQGSASKARPAEPVLAQAHLIAPPTLPSPPPKPRPRSKPAAQPAASAPASPASADANPVTPAPDAPAENSPTETATPSPAPAAPEPTSDTPDVLIARQLPPPALLDYALEGMSQGLHYSASSTLQWQFDSQRYELSLTVQAFLLGSRQWRSSGHLGPDGLLPDRFSDKRKSEVAAHFDREHQQIIFSNNKPTTPLLPGAQDQMSLFLQLGGAVNTSPDQFRVGSSLNVQTITPRSADLWHISLVGEDNLPLMGQPRLTRHWVCAPRGTYDSKLEFWTDPSLTGLPVRIRITQANGSYIDMKLSDLKDAPALSTP